MKKVLAGFIMDGKSGGLDTYLLHFIEAVWDEGVQIDFLTNAVDKDLESELQKYHARLIEIANLRKPVRQFRQVRKLIRKEKYDIAYFNISTSMDCVAAFAAKACGVPRRILHSHSGGNDCESVKKRKAFGCLQKICRCFFYKAGNEFCGCSKKAGYWMYPKKIVESEQFHVIYNAVDRNKFSYRPEVRRTVRTELGVQDKLVIGHVGNFCYQKNHEFLIRIFKEIYMQRPESVLMLVGDGVRFEQVKRQVEEEGLRDAVIFLGKRNDVDRLFQAMDVFLLPSHFEGLPTVGIEAQCTGLPCVISDSVTDETRISNRADFVSLKEAPKVWADCVLRWSGMDRADVNYTDEVQYYSLEDQKERLRKMICR